VQALSDYCYSGRAEECEASALGNDSHNAPVKGKRTKVRRSSALLSAVFALNGEALCELAGRTRTPHGGDRPRVWAVMKIADHDNISAVRFVERGASPLAGDNGRTAATLSCRGITFDMPGVIV
jgi:hypothetical protein